MGDAIEEFASDNATVVVGTVIDADMSDDLKVTVVATGLGAEAVRAPLQVVDTQSQASTPAQPDSVEKAARPPRARGSEEVTAENRSEAGSDRPGLAAAVGQEDYFDIPAFLRRQAD